MTEPKVYIQLAKISRLVSEVIAYQVSGHDDDSVDALWQELEELAWEKFGDGRDAKELKKLHPKVNKLSFVAELKQLRALSAKLSKMAKTLQSEIKKLKKLPDYKS